ncbi:MAG: endospore germination permease [Candidatus Pelethousia sp.]|nr:endospore germination permease [Candidatus Pelethousia sp.]
MKIDRSQISGSRFMFAVAFYLQSSSLLTSFVAGIAKHESWLSVLFGIVLALPLIYLYRTLMVNFPQKDLLQILEEVFGTILGKLLGIAYAWFFITLAALNLQDLGDFAKVTMMAKTPQLALTLVCLLVAVYAVRHGFKVVTQYGTLFTFAEFAILLITIILLSNQMNFQNFLPVFTQPAMKYIHSTHLILTIPFGELVVFLMCAPSVRLSPKGATRYWFGGVAIGMLTLLIVLLRDISILGEAISMFTLPGLMVLRLVNLGQTLSRMEILFAVALMMLLYFKISVLCYVATVTVARLLGVTTYKRLAIVMGILILAYSSTLFHSSVEHTASAWETTPVIWTPFEILLPLLTLIVAKIRKLPKTAEAPACGREA